MRLVFVFLLLVGCSAESTLVVQVRTDLMPGGGFDAITVSASGEGVTREEGRMASDPGDWGRGVRVAELDALPSGAYQLRVSALDADGDVVVSRPVRIELEAGIRVVTVLLTRDCAGVMCPGAGEPSAVACLGGRCVEEGCTEETPELCPMAECVVDGECGAASECAIAECSPSGTCFQYADPDFCPTGDRCDVDRGCIPPGTCSEWLAQVNQPGEAGPSAGEDVADAGASILVVWSEAGAGIRISPRDPETGAELETRPPIAPSGSLTRITTAPPGAFISWADGATLYATGVDPRGVSPGPITLTSARMPGDDWAATATLSRTVVTWSDTRSTPSIRHGITAPGTLMENGSTSVNAQSISHVDVGGGTILACYEMIGLGIRCDRVSAMDGSLLGTSPRFAPGGSSARPSAALGPPDDVGIAYEFGGAIGFATTDREGVFDTTSSPFVVADVTTAGAPSLAFDGTHYAVAYARDGLLEVVTWVAPDGTTELRSFMDTGTVTGPPRIIAAASGFYVVYRAEESESSTQNVYLQKICPPRGL